jgi:hypothetical protein
MYLLDLHRRHLNHLLRLRLFHHHHHRLRKLLMIQ